MAIYNAQRIRKPTYFRVGPLRRGRPKREPYIIGFDSEAENGKPFLFQFAHPNGKVDLLDIRRNKDSGLTAFLAYLADNCTRKDVEYLVVGFNLQYEYTQLFRSLPPDFIVLPELVFTWLLTDTGERFKIRAMNDKRYSFTVEIGGTKRRVKVIDAMAFLPTSLNEAGKIIDAGKKLPKPEKFQRKYRHTPEFIAYAEQDARLTQKLGEYILGLHSQYDVSTCVSAPHFAARTFRRHYMKRDLEPLTTELEQLGLDSYHGGKNGYYLDSPQYFSSVYNFDIRSAYPEAMAVLPNPEESDWTFSETYVPSTHSLWQASVIYRGCKYEPLYNVDNKRTRPSEKTQTISITGYELDSATECGCVTIISAKGWILNGPSGGPLFDYVTDFYKMKQTAATPAERTTAKLFLNSLYGKFFQKVPLGIVGSWDFGTGEFISTNPEQDFDYEAGGLYHPPLASLITGFVRAKIHRLEHKYSAIMTSTDGFFATSPPDENDLGSTLGKLDCSQGELRIWRERLYIFTPANGDKEKYALHGFRGKPAQLKHVPLTLGIQWKYRAQQMITNKMAIRSFRGKKYEPGQFATLSFVLDLAPRPP